MSQNTVLPTNKSQRGSLSSTRVNLLRSAMAARYKFSPVKGTKWFRAIVTTLNTKGRNILAKLKKEDKAQVPNHDS